MEAKELIIGDWVIFNDKPAQVAIIDDWEGEISYFDDDAGGVLTLINDYINPIPLTEEILRKNNLIYFHKAYEYDEWEVKTIKCSTWYTIDISHTIDENYDYIINDFPVGYVHELQHVLRLCGLSDLADNFKIE